MWAQELPPEGNACFSTASPQGLICRRDVRPRQGELPKLDTAPPSLGAPGAPRKRGGNTQGPWIPGRQWEGSPMKTTSDLQGILEALGSISSLHQ